MTRGPVAVSTRRTRSSFSISAFRATPPSALNPVMRIGAQIGEALRIHKKMSRKEAREESVRLLSMVSLPDPERQVVLQKGRQRLFRIAKRADGDDLVRSAADSPRAANVFRTQCHGRYREPGDRQAPVAGARPAQAKPQQIAGADPGHSECGEGRRPRGSRQRSGRGEPAREAAQAAHQGPHR